MDPVSLIIAAITAGAAAALKDTAGAAIKDAYSGLRLLIKRRLGGGPAADAEVESVERQPRSDASSLKAQLEAAGAAGDAELLRAARALLEQVDPEGARGGKYNVTVTGGKGVVVGDQATVTMNFGDSA
jgi:hypothetical protein